MEEIGRIKKRSLEMEEIGRIKKKQGNGTTGIRDTCIMDLPSDSLLQIFLRLPINAVIACKFVCREWNEFISHPDYARNYEKNPHVTTLLLPTIYDPFVNQREFSLLEISSEGGAIRTRIAPYLPGVPGWLIFDHSKSCFVGYVFWESGRVCVYNLITEERIGIQETINDHIDEGDCDYHIDEGDCDYHIDEGNCDWLYKFGYSSFMDKFKVLRFLYCYPYSYNEEVNCEILTIGVDHSWRYLSEPFRNGLSLNTGVVVNGVVHWFVEDGDAEWICTFEFGEEKIGKISHPNGLVLNSRTMYLSDYNDRLCLVDESDTSKLCIWVMKQYGVTESWVNYTALWSWFPIPCHIIWARRVAPRRLAPLAILPDGDMVFPHLGTDCLIYCNLKQRRCTITDPVFENPKALNVPLRMLRSFTGIDLCAMRFFNSLYP